MTATGSPLARNSVLHEIVRTEQDYLINRITNASSALQYSDLAGLKHTIDSAYSIASRRLFDVFFEKFKLLDHFKALKNYLFLGHGDFADYLMESLA